MTVLPYMAKSKVADKIKVANQLTKIDYPRLSTQMNISPYKWKSGQMRRQSDMMGGLNPPVLSFKTEEEASTREFGQLLGAGKGKGTRSPLEPPEGVRPLN